MKKIYLLPILLSFCLLSHAQDDPKYHYQMVVLEGGYDRNTEKYFVSLNTESGLVEFPELKKLVPYSSKRGGNSQPSTYFTGQSDTTSSFYNFFLNSTQALGYLARNGWELITVLSNTHHVSGDRSSIVTDPVYYFRKKVITPVTL